VESVAHTWSAEVDLQGLKYRWLHRWWGTCGCGAESLDGLRVPVRGSFSEHTAW
jgi:hypothetical protein